jgi:hypothetical protein
VCGGVGEVEKLGFWRDFCFSSLSDFSFFGGLEYFLEAEIVKWTLEIRCLGPKGNSRVG